MGFYGGPPTVHSQIRGEVEIAYDKLPEAEKEFRDFMDGWLKKWGDVSSRSYWNMDTTKETY